MDGKWVDSMGRLTIYKDNYADATAVSNIFIDEYMKDANDAQLKIYLYLIRMTNANLSTSVSDIADKFNHTEKDVLRALKYWEKKRLLALEYDEAKNLTGIHLLDFDRPASTSKPLAPVVSLVARPFITESGTPSRAETTTASAKDVYEKPSSPAGNLYEKPSSPVGNLYEKPSSPAGNLYEKPSSPAGNLYEKPSSPAGNLYEKPSSPAGNLYEKPSSPAADPYKKPSYSRDQLKAFQTGKETSQLVFIVEQYMGKPLTSTEIQSIFFISDKLGFSVDLIDYLVQYCVDRGKKDFRYIEKVAVSWAQSGISTPEQAQKHSYKYDKTVYEVMNALGKATSPTSKEVDFIQRWLREFGFEMEIILTACERTVMATDRHRFEYADSILANWYRTGIRHKSDILKADENFRRTKISQSRTSGNSKLNQFKQNTYDFEALEQELLSN